MKTWRRTNGTCCRSQTVSSWPSLTPPVSFLLSCEAYATVCTRYVLLCPHPRYLPLHAELLHTCCPIALLLSALKMESMLKKKNPALTEALIWTSCLHFIHSIVLCRFIYVSITFCSWDLTLDFVGQACAAPFGRCRFECLHIHKSS